MPEGQFLSIQTSCVSRIFLSLQHYIDGALSNNMPLFEQRNTITIAPFSGESDICPREGTFNFFEVHYGNVSIQVNTGNVHRICTSFLPPRPEVGAFEMKSLPRFRVTRRKMNVVGLKDELR